nr:MAG TPA: hypothetical protein [Caudoviricetes sp.]
MTQAEKVLRHLKTGRFAATEATEEEEGDLIVYAHDAS